MEIVELLLIKENRDLFSWFGGGLCIIGGALWTVFKYRRSTTSKGKSEDTGTSNFGGVSVFGTGNDLKDVTISTHIVQNRTGGVETTGLALFFLGLCFSLLHTFRLADRKLVRITLKWPGLLRKWPGLLRKRLLAK